MELLSSSPLCTAHLCIISGYFITEIKTDRAVLKLKGDNKSDTVRIKAADTNELYHNGFWFSTACDLEDV